MTIAQLTDDGYIVHLWGQCVVLVVQLSSRADHPYRLLTDGTTIDRILGALIKSHILSHAFSKVSYVDRRGISTRPAAYVCQAVGPIKLKHLAYNSAFLSSGWTNPAECSTDPPKTRVENLLRGCIKPALDLL